jgi:hypothetical protein
MQHFRISIFLFFSLLVFSSNAQVNVRDSAVQGYIFNFNLGYHVPSGDVGELYGPHMSLGLDIEYKTKSNWLIGGGVDYLFGTNVKNAEALLGDFFTEDGNIIGTNGDYVTVKPFMRGWVFQAKVGKILPLFGPNPNSGLLLQGGVGFIQHKTRLEHDNIVYQLLPPYDKGYDRLHQGLALSQYIAFYHSGNRRRVNFTAGFHFMQGFTNNVREYNYHTRSYDLDNKLDLYFGIKASWFLPIYDKHAQKYYYY